jgi:hypothetical protein
MTPFDTPGWTILFYTDFRIQWDDVADLFAVLQKDDNSSK